MIPLSRREAIALVGLGVLGACAGGDDAAPTTASSTPAAPTTTGSTSTTIASAHTTVVARSEVDFIDVFDEEDSTEPARRLDRTAETTGNLVFVVDQQAAGPDDRHLVQLPVRPNGSTGWVRADDVSLTVHDYRLEVELGAHQLRLLQAGEALLEVPIGVGTQDTPTPGGTYYVKELLQPPEPDGPYGTYAYGLSGFSNVLESFAGGDGVIGIHGTDRPELVGRDVSSGCIRVTNDVMDRLVEEIGLPLGIPVVIRA
ncbi:MAG: L,D-transpeptidase [Acidimicrobiales bacterium]